ncbi:unnamed protein product [Arctogadus glacialis]
MSSMLKEGHVVVACRGLFLLPSLDHQRKWLHDGHSPALSFPFMNGAGLGEGCRHPPGYIAGAGVVVVLLLVVGGGGEYLLWGGDKELYHSPPVMRDT